MLSRLGKNGSQFPTDTVTREPFLGVEAASLGKGGAETAVSRRVECQVGATLWQGCSVQQSLEQWLQVVWQQVPFLGHQVEAIG